MGEYRRISYSQLPSLSTFSMSVHPHKLLKMQLLSLLIPVVYPLRTFSLHDPSINPRSPCPDQLFSISNHPSKSSTTSSTMLSSTSPLTILLLSLLPSLASAHGYVNTAIIGGTTYTGYQPYQDPYMSPAPQRIFRKIAGNGPIEDISSIDLQCGGWQNSGSAPAPLTATVAAGSTISLQWTIWPDSVSTQSPFLTPPRW